MFSLSKTCLVTLAIYLNSPLNIHVTYLEHLFSSRAFKHFMHYILRWLLMPRYLQSVSQQEMSRERRNAHLYKVVWELQCHARWKVLLNSLLHNANFIYFARTQKLWQVLSLWLHGNQVFQIECLHCYSYPLDNLLINDSNTIVQ